MKRVVITGAKGLLGWHAHAHLHAANCAARFKGAPALFEIRPLDHAGFDSDAQLADALTHSDAVLHFAGVNRAPDDVVEHENQAIADRLVSYCASVDAQPHIVYANSTHAESDTPYGRGKAGAARILSQGAGAFTNMILPHIFGECAKPNYNNVTATFIDKILSGQEIQPNPDGRVSLLHAGTAARLAVDAMGRSDGQTLTPAGHPMSVPDLLERLSQYHASYQSGIIPDVQNDFDLALFNTYRAATYPSAWPRPLKLNTDARGTLFEAIKGGGGGQCFVSTTLPGVTRGDHFHLGKVERFLVLQGEAMIRIRKVLSDDVWEYRVSGDDPAPVDMPTLHTHSIENIGSEPLMTLFWTHDLFDPAAPDTFADKVLQ